MAVTAVELIIAPRPQTTTISRTSSRVSLLPAFADQPVAEPPGDAGPHQAVADHEQRRDQHDVRVAEARQRLAHRDARP